MKVDAQLVERLGKNRLITEIVSAGFEVAEPIRDRGVDLLAYGDLDARNNRFVARPVQIKAASRRAFCLKRRYERFAGLLMAYVWHVNGSAPPETFVLTYPEALSVLEEMRYSETRSWQLGSYVTTKPSPRICKLLEPYRGTGERWRLLMKQGPGAQTRGAAR